MSYKEVMHSTPAAIQLFLTAYAERRKEEMELREQTAWLNGVYVLRAIGAAFDKKSRYPDNPIVEKEKRRTDFTDEEKERYAKILFGQLNVMKENFEMNHKGGA